eukprot:352911-Chlamydomonas_euryale.AAC.2
MARRAQTPRHFRAGTTNGRVLCVDGLSAGCPLDPSMGCDIATHRKELGCNPIKAVGGKKTARSPNNVADGPRSAARQA